MKKARRNCDKSIEKIDFFRDCLFLVFSLVQVVYPKGEKMCKTDKDTDFFPKR